MPDLALPTVAAWVEDRDPTLASFEMSGPVDKDPAALSLMLRFGVVLDRALADGAQQLSDRLRDRATANNLRAALAQAGLARRMRLLAWFLEDGLPEQAALLESITAGTTDGAFLRGELTALHRRAKLCRIFDPERIRSLLAACGQTADGVPA